MKPFVYWLCSAVMLLEWIPAYRRVHLADGRASDRYTYCPPGFGFWGINLLTRMHLFGRYVDEIERRFGV